MSNTRRQLILDIAAMEQILQYQRMKARAHEKYLVDLMTEYRVIFSIALLSSLFIGLKKGREKGMPQFMKRIIRFGLFTFATHFKRRLITN